MSCIVRVFSVSLVSTSHPKQFPCEISPRSSQALKLLQELP